jgi:hypothetical protein
MSLRFRKHIALVTGLFAALSIGQTYAAETSLEFDLITVSLESRKFDAPGIDGQVLSQSKLFGVAVFKDGKYGTKDFINSGELKNGVGMLNGYSTYNFQEGTVSARWEASVGPDGVHGKYKILSGTGKYSGATGAGTLDSIPNPFKSSGLYKVRLQINTP